MEDKQSFGRYIREKRTGLGLSQRELAERLFVTESAVSKWERGVSYPDITQITPLCEALGVSEHELVTASDDWRQRRLEAEAHTHRRVRATWLWGIGAIYALTVLGVGISALTGSGRLIDVAIATAACLMCASLTHVPVLARDDRGTCTLLAFFVTLCLLVSAGIAGGASLRWQADVGVALVALLFTFVLLAGPYLVSWACGRFRVLEPLKRHRALVCLAADTALLFCLVAVVSAYYDPTNAGVAWSLAMAVMLMVPVWTTFLAVRYLPTALPFRLAVAFAAFGLWLFLANGIANLTMGLPFDWHTSVNFADWTSYPAVNDNICWLVLGVCVAVAAALCVIGALWKGRDQSSR